MTDKMHLPLKEIVDELRALCEAQRTGVFRVTTDQNHTAQFGLDAGRIVSARYRIKRGLEALELMKRVNAGSFGFEAGADAGEDVSLPESEVILAQLAQAASASASPAAPSTTPATPPAAALGASEFSAAARIALEDALTEHIGPMAGIVCRNVLSRATNIGEAIEMMKAKIPDPARAEQFERNVMSRTLA